MSAWEPSRARSKLDGEEGCESSTAAKRGSNLGRSFEASAVTPAEHDEHGFIPDDGDRTAMCVCVGGERNPNGFMMWCNSRAGQQALCAAKARLPCCLLQLLQIYKLLAGGCQTYIGSCRLRQTHLGLTTSTQRSKLFSYHVV